MLQDFEIFVTIYFCIMSIEIDFFFFFLQLQFWGIFKISKNIDFIYIVIFCISILTMSRSIVIEFCHVIQFWSGRYLHSGGFTSNSTFCRCARQYT